jgi:hypothetical protein
LADAWARHPRGAKLPVVPLRGQGRWQLSQAPYVLCGHYSGGDIGWIVHRQGILYAQEYGWDVTFEALVAEIAGAFVETCNPQQERCWVGEHEGEIAGGVWCATRIRSPSCAFIMSSPRCGTSGIARHPLLRVHPLPARNGYNTLALVDQRCADLRPSHLQGWRLQTGQERAASLLR